MGFLFLSKAWASGPHATGENVKTDATLSEVILGNSQHRLGMQRCAAIAMLCKTKPTSMPIIRRNCLGEQRFSPSVQHDRAVMNEDLHTRA